MTLRRKRLVSITLLKAKLLGAGVAQLVEQKTLNLLVVGSNPSARTKATFPSGFQLGSIGQSSYRLFFLFGKRNLSLKEFRYSCQEQKDMALLAGFFGFQGVLDGC